MKKAIISLAGLACITLCSAQKDEKITSTAVVKKCADFPLEKRARISVTRFNVTTSTDDAATRENANNNNSLKALSTIFNGGNNTLKASELPPTLGQNLGTMLTANLQTTSCYRVLESLSNNNDLTAEIDAGEQSHYAKKKSAPNAGKQLGAQLVVTGEITEYSVKERGLKIAGLGGGKKLVKLGFILKLTNPETRDVITSPTFRAESKTSNYVQVGVVSTTNDDPAVAAVMQDAIIKAAEWMGHLRDSLNITADNIPGGSSLSNGSTNEIEVTLSGATFNAYSNLSAIIASLPGYASMDKSFSNNAGSYTVQYKGDGDKLLEALMQKAGNKYEVTAADKAKIDLKLK